MTLKSKQPQGFTLIELIVVIVIIGVLAVVAAPRFVSFSSDANIAVIQAIEGSVKSTAEIYNTKAQIEASNGGFDAGFEVNGVAFELGYPVAASSNDTDDIPEIIEALTLSEEVVFAASNVSVAPNGELSRLMALTILPDLGTPGTADIIATNCFVSYRSFVSSNDPPITESVTTGC
jgi:MSHA pilin protein MshA